MRVPAGMYVISRRSERCPVCRDTHEVQVLDPGAPYGPIASVIPCPHCATEDPDQSVPVVHLPHREDHPRGVDRDR
jgi:hypothetical protein